MAGKEARRVAADLGVVKARVERLLPRGVRGGVFRRVADLTERGRHLSHVELRGHCPRRKTPKGGCYAPCAPILKCHTKVIHYGCMKYAEGA